MKSPKPCFKKICIIGVGLIGGSLGLAIKKRRLAKFVVGVTRRKQSAMEAVSRKAVDMATLDLKEGVSGADLVILAGPIPAIISQIKILSKYLSPNSIVIDVGSSKVKIDAAARHYLKKSIFVGCHPMAGSEQKGVSCAEADLFKGAPCFMTKKNERIEKLWRTLESKSVFISAAKHDEWVAQSSHLPHALSFSLFQNIKSRYPYNPSLKELGRLACSDANLWADIFLSNQKEVLGATGKFQKSLSGFQKILRKKNKTELVRFILAGHRSVGV